MVEIWRKDSEVQLRPAEVGLSADQDEEAGDNRKEVGGEEVK